MLSDPALDFVFRAGVAVGLFLGVFAMWLCVKVAEVQRERRQRARDRATFVHRAYGLRRDGTIGPGEPDNPLVE